MTQMMLRLNDRRSWTWLSPCKKHNGVSPYDTAFVPQISICCDFAIPLVPGSRRPHRYNLLVRDKGSLEATLLFSAAS